MEFLRPLKDVILSFTNKELLLWIYGYLAAVVFMAGLYLFLHTRSIQEMHVQMNMWVNYGGIRIRSNMQTGIKATY